MSLPFPPGDGNTCFGYDPNTQSPLNSITFTYSMSFDAISAAGEITASLDITQTYERAPFSMTDAYGDAVPDQQFVLVRTACSNNILIGNSFVGDGSLVNSSLLISTAAAGTYNTTSDTPPCAESSNADLTIGIVGGFSNPGGDILTGVQLYFSITNNDPRCFSLTDINELFSGQTDPFDVTCDTLAEFLDEHDISITIPNPNPLFWLSWSATATASFTGA